MAIMHLGFQSVNKTAPPVGNTIPVGVYGITVAGAGTTAVNKLYTWDSANSRWLYSTSYQVRYSGGHWLISNYAGTIDYYSSSDGDANNLPKTGWAKVSALDPAPTITATTIATGITPIYVVGAGTTNVNGAYVWDSTRWLKSENSCTVEYSKGGWGIKEGTNTRYVNSGGNSGNVPKSGWSVNIGVGSAPAPTISDTAP